MKMESDNCSHWEREIYPMLSNPDNFDWANVRDYFPFLPFIHLIQERFMLNLPFYHAFGFGNLIWSLIVGSIGIVMEKFSRRPYLEAIEKYRVQYLSKLSTEEKDWTDFY